MHKTVPRTAWPASKWPLHFAATHIVIHQRQFLHFKEKSKPTLHFLDSYNLFIANILQVFLRTNRMDYICRNTLIFEGWKFPEKIRKDGLSCGTKVCGGGSIEFRKHYSFLSPLYGRVLAAKDRRKFQVSKQWTEYFPKRD